jgi:hypothetical protein
VTELDILLHHIPRMLPAVPRTFDRPASSTTCAYASETSHVDPFTDKEENNNTVAPVAEVLLGIGSVFASEEDKVENSPKVLG